MNFGVIGPGKMGQLFIRDFIKCGAKLTYVKASSLKRTNKIIKKFQKEGLLKNNNLKSVDSLIISSKTNTHYKYINNFYNKKKLLIEKPFFFCKNKSYYWHLNKAKVFLKSKKFIDINLSNDLFGDIYKKQKFYKKKNFKKFFFKFYTGGKNNYKFIILDLMPHFFSIIQRLTPCKSVKIIEKKVEKFKTFLVLKVDNFVCYIDLRERQKIKELSFGFDNFILTRKQIFNKESLKNYLYNKKYNLKIEIPNPLNKFTNNYYKNFKKNSNTFKKKFIYENFKLTLKTYFFKT
jgi:hypothetical protein